MAIDRTEQNWPEDEVITLTDMDIETLQAIGSELSVNPVRTEITTNGVEYFYRDAKSPSELYTPIAEISRAAMLLRLEGV